jgi:predicted RNA-binding protein with PUA-like domain
MGYWLLKTEPGSYGWDDLVRERETEWTGVRNHAAAAHLRAMAAGDGVLLYHSGAQKAVVGIAEVSRIARLEHAGAPWTSVAIRAGAALAHPVTLAAMKRDPALAGMAMLRQTRLSVSPVTEAEWAAIVAAGA